jgi:hypothetical protein
MTAHTRRGDHLISAVVVQAPMREAYRQPEPVRDAGHGGAAFG